MMSILRAKAVFLAIFLVSGVLAFVVRNAGTSISSHHHRTRPSIVLHAVDDLKSLLDSSSYESDVVKAYAGKKVKSNIPSATTATKGNGLSYDLSTTTSTPPPIQSAEQTVQENAALVSPLDPPPPTVDTLTPMPEISSPPVPTTPAAASDSAISTVSIPSDVQEAIEKPFSALNNFLKTTQENIRQAQQQAEEMKAAASTTTGGSDYSSQKVPTLAEYLAAPIVEQRKASSSAALTERTAVDIKLPEMDIKLPSVNIKLPDVPLPEFGTEPVTPVVVPPGKALPLGDYFRAKVSGALPADPTVQSSVANAKTKIGIMLANFYQLIGRDAPATLDLSDLSKSVENFGFDDLKAMVESIPVGAPLTAFAVGTFLVVLGGRNELAAKNEKPPTPQTMEAASAALGSLTDDLETLQQRMKILEETGSSLQAELKAAKEKLLEKELEISKERLKVADSTLKLNREVDKLQRKLNENIGQVKALDSELTATREESGKLAKELETAQTQVAQKKEESVAPKPVDEPTKEPVKSAAAEPVAPEPVKNPAKMPAMSSDVAGRKAPKGTPKTTAVIAEDKMEELPTATEEKVKPVSKKKAATKKASTKKASTKKSASEMTAELSEKEELPMVSVEETPPKKKAETKKTAVKKSAATEPPKEKAATKKTASKKSAATNELNSLSKSSLARKTVKELTDYLDSKGVSTTGDDGKPLKKSDLVDAVLSLS